MKSEIKEAYKLTSKLFNNIGVVCRGCDTCCRTYGWLLKDEAKQLSKRGYPIVEINNKLYCIDSFKINNHKKRVLEKIPICRFYKNKKCQIHKNKPFDCRLYPLKLIFENGKPVWVISLGCKYVSKLNKIQMDNLIRTIKIRLNKIPSKILEEYISLMGNIHKISKPKRFWKKRID